MRLETLLAIIALCLTAFSSVISPDRVSIAIIVLPFAIAFQFLPARSQQLVWLAAVPWAILLNLAPHSEISVGQFHFYHSEAMLLLLASSVTIRLRSPAGASRIARRSVAAYMLWIIIAEVAALPGLALQLLLQTLCTVLLAWLSFRIAAAIGQGGISTLAFSVTAWIAILGLAAFHDSVISNGVSVFASTGSLVAGSEMLAIQVSFLLPVALSYALLCPHRNRVFQVGAWMAVLVGFIALIMSFSRSGWVGGFVGMILVACGAGPKDRTKILPAMLAAAIIFLTSLIVITEAKHIQKEWSVELIQRFRSLFSSELLADRAPAWSSALSILANHPLFGDAEAPNCYNLFLMIASRSGWPALALFLLAILTCTKHHFSSAFATIHEPLALGFVAGIIGFLITGIGESSLGTRMTPLFFTVMGLLAGTGHSEVSRHAGHGEQITRFSAPGDSQQRH